MCFGSTSIDAFFDTNVQLVVPVFTHGQPYPASPLQRFRFLDLPEAHHSAIKRPRRFHIGSGDGDLCVVNSSNRAWHCPMRFSGPTRTLGFFVDSASLPAAQSPAALPELSLLACRPALRSAHRRLYRRTRV